MTHRRPQLWCCRKDDLEFWNINELLLEPCCALKYFPDIEASLNKL